MAGARGSSPVAAGRTALIVTHGSVVRAIKKELEGLDAKEISQVNIPTGVPLTDEFEALPGGRASVPAS